MYATRRSFLAVVIAAGAFAAACADTGDPSATGSTSTGNDDPDRTQVEMELEALHDEQSDDESDDDQEPRRPRGLRLTLAPFSDCSAFLDHVKAEARDRVGPYGLDGTGHPAMWPRADMDMAATTAAPAAAAEASLSLQEATGAASGQVGDGGGDPSIVAGTNTQEAGVDEPDIIKADGERIITVSDNVLTYVDITSGQPFVAGTLILDEGWGHQLFLYGDRALLLSNAGTWGEPMPVDTGATLSDELIAPGPIAGWPAATILEIDLSQPSTLRVAASLRLEGQYLNAWTIGDRLLLAVSSGPQWMPWLYPESPNGEDRAHDANLQLVDESTLADWVPQYELTVEGETSSGDLLDCARLNRPAEFSGFDVISVLGIDLDNGIANGFADSDSVGVLAGGQTVYASLDRFYVATTKWLPVETLADDQSTVWAEDYETELHAFAITAGAPVEYIASGSVAGSLLNSFALDEHNGFLRVITTDGTPWDQSNLSETRLTVFEEQGDALIAIGEVGGLGRGEALYSARMIGDRGFAVTFRQVDPFYVLDLTDPRAPRVTGELKIPGFSTYLHPVGDHRVLGVGRSATDDGVVTGLKVSLFDVNDPANPVELSTWSMPDAQSQAEYDHHAFQMIGSTAILPVQSFADGFNGAIVLEIGDTIIERGQITHHDPDQQPTSDCRELVESDLPATHPAYWLAADIYSRVNLCGANHAGGYGDWYCERVTISDAPNWFGFDQSAIEDLAALNGGELDRIEICYSQHDYLDGIQRSIVIDSTLWTLSPGALRAHDLGTLEALGGIDLR